MVAQGLSVSCFMPNDIFSLSLSKESTLTVTLSPIFNNSLGWVIRPQVIGIGLIVLTWLSGNSVIQGTMNVGDFVLINGYLLQFVQPLSWFGYILRKMRKGLTDLENIFNMLHLQPEVSNAPSAIDLKITKAEVTFDHVSFGYDPSRTILRDVSFHVPAGKHLGIVGPSGAGKSTIARLLFRFYDVNKGAILINNHDIRTVSQKSQ